MLCVSFDRLHYGLCMLTGEILFGIDVVAYLCHIDCIIFIIRHLWGGYLSDVIQNSLLQELSAVSFTFYMIHQMAINVLLSIFGKLQIHIPYLVELIACLFIIMFAAIIVNKYFEKPIANYLSKKI